MFSIINLFHSKFNPDRPSEDSACAHLNRLVSRLSPSPADHRDRMALFYISDSIRLMNPRIREIIFSCIKLTVSEKDYDDGRVKGTPCLAKQALHIMTKHPGRFHEFGERLFGKLNEENFELVTDTLRALGPLSQVRWPKGLGAIIGRLLNTSATRSGALEFCILYGGGAGDEIGELSDALSRMARLTLDPDAPIHETIQLLTALGTLAAVPPEMQERITAMTQHAKSEVRCAALFAFASTGSRVVALIKQELQSSNNFTEHLAGAAVTAVKNEEEGRELVSTMLNSGGQSSMLILRALRKSLPEIQRLFTADLTLIALATDRNPKDMVDLARDILRVSGCNPGPNEEGQIEQDFFTFTTSENLRDSIGLLVARAA